MRWDKGMREVVKNNYPNKTYKEIALMLGVSPKSIERQLHNMGLLGLAKRNKNDNKQTYTKIGCRRRANNKYNAILTRLTTTDRKKNKSYNGVELRVSRKDFIEWYMPLDFEGASVDRIDKNGHYELSNMQVILLDENIRKDKIKAKDNYCECYICKQMKPIEAFCIDKRRKNGHSTICKECERIRGKEKYHRLKKRKSMLSVKTLEIAGIASVLRALRLPFGLECRSDIKEEYYGWVDESDLKNWHFENSGIIYEKDLHLLSTLVKRGDEHAKVLRGVIVYLDIDAPRFWWQEMDTYKVGTDRLSSESTMHIQGKGLSEDELVKMKSELKEGTMQRRIQMFSYQTLRRIYHQRKNHRLPHWRVFCSCIESLPFAKELILWNLEN